MIDEPVDNPLHKLIGPNKICNKILYKRTSYCFWYQSRYSFDVTISQFHFVPIRLSKALAWYTYEADRTGQLALQLCGLDRGLCWQQNIFSLMENVRKLCDVISWPFATPRGVCNASYRHEIILSRHEIILSPALRNKFFIYTNKNFKQSFKKKICTRIYNLNRNLTFIT